MISDIHPQDLVLILSLLSLGFLGGFTHCSGMCGPIVLTQVSRRLKNSKIEDYRGLKKLKNLSLIPYHLGRITTYSLVGFICSVSRKKIDNLIGIHILSVILITFACIIFIGIFFHQNQILMKETSKFKKKILLPFKKGFIKILPNYFIRFTSFFFKEISKRIGFLMHEKSPIKTYFLGIILGFIPCGMLYGAFAIASSFSNPIMAWIGMILFGIATFPALFMVASFGNLILKLPERKIISNTLILINIFVLTKLVLKQIF